MANSATWQNTTFNVGDTISVQHKIKEAGKERLQTFEGIVIAIKNQKEGKSFTVRKISANQIGVERIWPLLCPSIKKIKLISHGKVRRAKLYYLRKRFGREALKVGELSTLNKDGKQKFPKQETKTGQTR
jgi:large subunit ribosomal protein L19